MDPALKQRLLGAAVLVALAVIFLPMLLDSPSPPSGEAMRVEIPPPPDRRFETRVLPLDGGQPQADPADRPAVALPAEEPIATLEVEVPPRIDALTGEDISGAAQPPAPRTEPPPASPVERQPTTRLPASAAEGRFVVNLGSFGQRANADGLVQRLQAAGIRAQVDQVTANGRTLSRVRSGPYRTRTEADQVRLAAQRAVSDLNATISELADAASADPSPGRAAGWAVQVGVFGQEENANALRDRLRQGGFAAYVQRLDGNGGPNWRVRVGPEADRDQADRLKASLSSRFQLDGLVVAHP
ncbi:MAG TPA: SPOR domain-containing protein [Xanthomonadaceae bacterium]|nr:SPOR domain-containing protein [Xanthomonadaceae bacterium]